MMVAIEGGAGGGQERGDGWQEVQALWTDLCAGNVEYVPSERPQTKGRRCVPLS